MTERPAPETWKPVPSYPGYHASDLGRIRGPRKVLRPEVNQDGYLFVSPWVGGRGLYRGVHRLVCEAFHGPCPEGMECRHRDGVRTNNVPGNLCWGTKSENQADRLHHGTHSRGARSSHSKLTSVQALEVYRRAHAGESQKALAQEFGISEHHVSHIKTGQKWRWLTRPSMRERKAA